MAARDQVMSSMERAPEPTMEEILASIRRIISEDESNSTRQPEAQTSRQDDEGLEVAEGDADDKIINDIARVLSGSAQTPATEEEEILDLTAELGGLEIVEEETVVLETIALETIAEAAPVEADPEPMALEPVMDVMEMSQAEAAPEPQPAFQPQPEPIAQTPLAPPAPMSASEEAASALERAIAALRAGQLPTSISEFAPQPQPVFQPAAEAYDPPVSEPVSLPEFEPEPQPEPEPELVLTDFEAEAVIEEPALAELASQDAPEPVPAWESEPAPWAGSPEPFVEPERLSLRSNGHSAEAPLDGEPKTLEDSIKDMLRPMLRQWLDENMPRMVTAALKDELRNNPARFQPE
jgi:uncharacterized protein